jgi:ribonuclease-3
LSQNHSQLSQAFSDLCKRLRYRFSDATVLKRALTHRSYGGEHYERVEFLGDAVLGVAIAEALLQRFPDADEGSLTRLRANLVRQASLATLARDIRLGESLRLGSGEVKSGGYDRDSILADGLEAIFGAIYLDGGFAAARKVILTLYSERLSSLPAEAVDKDPKTRLQEWLQSRKMPLPSYQVLEVEGEAHDQLFTIECRISGIDAVGVGKGKSRRRAERVAAEQMLQSLGDE